VDGNLIEESFHSPQQGLPAAAEHWSRLPIHVLTEQPCRLEARLPAQVAERGKPPNRGPVKQLPSAALDLRTPDDQTRREATEKPRDGQFRPPVSAHIALRAVSA
jgi:hypothetical protein